MGHCRPRSWEGCQCPSRGARCSHAGNARGGRPCRRCPCTMAPRAARAEDVRTPLRKVLGAAGAPPPPPAAAGGAASLTACPPGLLLLRLRLRSLRLRLRLLLLLLGLRRTFAGRFADSAARRGGAILLLACGYVGTIQGRTAVVTAALLRWQLEKQSSQRPAELE